MPKKFTPLQGKDIGQIVVQLNRNLSMLDKEVDTKTYGGKNGTDGLTIGRTSDTTVGMVVKQDDKKVLEIGIYQTGRAGLLIYDAAGVPIALFGQAPDDARVGAWVTLSGTDVLEQLGG